jgi:DNA-binding transcriptional LysR family regulator
MLCSTSIQPPSQLREKPAGTVRITTSHHAAETILWPALARLLSHYPDIRVELSIDPALTDIVAERYDAGVRLGEQAAKDTIAVRIGPDMRHTILPTTHASTCAYRLWAGSTPGSSARMAAS